MCAVLGSLLIAFPDKMLSYISLFIGGAFIVCGVFAIINYAIKRNYVFTLTLGIIAAVSGVIICLAYRQIISVIVFLMGIFLLVGSLSVIVNFPVIDLHGLVSISVFIDFFLYLFCYLQHLDIRYQIKRRKDEQTYSEKLNKSILSLERICHADYT